MDTLNIIGRPYGVAPGLGGRVFRRLVGLIGVVVVYSGLDTAFGGFETLGLQGLPEFWEITNQDDFDVVDSHQRLRGGVWMGVGILLVAGAVLNHLGWIRTAFFLTLAGGLSRLSQGRFDILFGQVFPVAAIELIITPALWVWSFRLTDRQNDGTGEPR